VATFALVLLPAAAWAALFPVSEPFHTATTNNPDWRFLGSAGLTNQGDGWLRLTPASPINQAGAAVLDDAFSSHLGLDVNFQYAAWGGTALNGRRGDGFTFFLVNGSAAPSVGQHGQNLGYRGITDAYAGVGFDEYGGFAASPDHIAVRGPAPSYPSLASAPAPGGIYTGNSTTGVRSARITITPDAAGHLLLSVLSNQGPGTPLEHVITDLNLGTAPDQGALPATLKLGFSAGTGSATNNYEIRDLTVTVPTDLSIVKQHPLEVPPGGPVQYVLNVADNGPNPATGAVVHDAVPPEVTGVSWRCEPILDATCAAPASGTGNNVTSHVSFTRPGGTARIVITGRLSPTAALGSHVTNTATISPPADRHELTPHDNTATGTFTVGTVLVPGSADLSITKAVDNARPLFGANVAFTLTLTNRGPDDVGEAIVRDELPAGLVYVSDNAAATGTRYEPLGGVWDAGALAAGRSKTLRVTVSVQTRTPVRNQVDRIDSDLQDPTPCPDHCGNAVYITPMVTLVPVTG
jgi:uncharacterized repeat protein (TIGR01451 family)